MFRSGCQCNPGACFGYLGLTNQQVRARQPPSTYTSAHAYSHSVILMAPDNPPPPLQVSTYFVDKSSCGDGPSVVEDGTQPLGALRISIGQFHPHPHVAIVV